LCYHYGSDDEEIHLMRQSIAMLVALLAAAALVRAQEPSVSYPALGHLDAGEGAIEFWLRFEGEPGDGPGQVTHFTIFNIICPGDPRPRVMFGYQQIWSPKNLHFLFNSWGLINGANVGNGYIATVEETQLTSKADVGGKRYPRTPRLKKGDWHHLALVWQGDPQTLAIYIDGELMLRPYALQAPIWEGLYAMALDFVVGPYAASQSIDELRLSSRARTAEEVRQAYQARRAAADKFTTVLDHCDQFRPVGNRWETVPEVFAVGLDVRGGRIARTNSVELVDGPSGKALQLWRR
jgi:hypothetical protein